MHWRWRLADTEPDRPSLRVRVCIGRTESRPRIELRSETQTLKMVAVIRLPVGLIPAHAGKTRWAIDTINSKGGSSPLTRGKHVIVNVHCPTRGLIPAHAGKTHSAGSDPSIPRAHPRSRGENALQWSSCRPYRGSSPLTRGKPQFGSHLIIRQGLIPAHAGKTSWSRRPTPTVRAHPRSRGENSSSPRTPPTWAGSSPLTRGKRRLPASVRRRPGLIPAHAGKTGTGWGPVLAGRAHPRSRGENEHKPWILPATSGSSPLTRGKRRRGNRR